jgi:hypothetical protein
MIRTRRVGLFAFAIPVVFVLLAASAGADNGPELLPDLDPAAPVGTKAVGATDGSGKVFLTFKVAIDNLGAGPLIVQGHRASTADPEMTADQVVQLATGSTITLPAIGRLIYDTQYTRWGFQPYQTYELRGSDGSLLGTGPEMNFCLEDNANANTSVVLPGEPASKVYVGCGKRMPTRLSLDVGISVGWQNQHAAGKKGQMIDITSLPSGQYVLVQRVDPAGVLTESNEGNNVSSTRISITWVSGATLPTIRVLRRCADTESC